MLNCLHEVKNLKNTDIKWTSKFTRALERVSEATVVSSRLM